MSSLLENSIVDIINNYSTIFLNKKNVVGVALGYKSTNNLNTNIPCLTVFVSKKMPLNELYTHDLIPKNFFGIKTDVFQTGTLKLQLSSYVRNKFFSWGLSLRKRPLQAGYSIGAVGSKGFGTLGCIVYTRDTKTPCILSNNHVLADLNSLKKGTKILQPPYKFFGNSSKNLAGELLKFTALFPTDSKFSFENSIDAAIAEIPPNIPFSDSIPKIGYINGYNYEPKVGTKIQKVGASTGYTNGTITNINATVKLELRKGRIYKFKNQIISTAMCRSGDSGSLALDFSSNEAIGLYCGGSDETSIFNPIFNVLSSLYIDLKN